mmetsp:Transcript_55176/g.91260  ORF Transcript_55176/g.91260 Transcript_55176/m.91260 type:complete len:308 (-) Transcript_55176:899-1822(-)
MYITPVLQSSLRILRWGCLLRRGWRRHLRDQALRFSTFGRVVKGQSGSLTCWEEHGKRPLSAEQPAVGAESTQHRGLPEQRSLIKGDGDRLRRWRLLSRIQVSSVSLSALDGCELAAKVAELRRRSCCPSGSGSAFREEHCPKLMNKYLWCPFHFFSSLRCFCWPVHFQQQLNCKLCTRHGCNSHAKIRKQSPGRYPSTTGQGGRPDCRCIREPRRGLILKTLEHREDPAFQSFRSLVLRFIIQHRQCLFIPQWQLQEQVLTHRHIGVFLQWHSTSCQVLLKVLPRSQQRLRGGPWKIPLVQGESNE